MNPICNNGAPCIVTCVGIFLAWWLLASTLLWLTWNRVLGAMIKLKSAELWQSLLLVATVSVFVLPCSILRKQNCAEHLPPGGPHHCYREDSNEECPFSRRGSHHSAKDGAGKEGSAKAGPGKESSEIE